jgi:hypothetical protein
MEKPRDKPHRNQKHKDPTYEEGVRNDRVPVEPVSEARTDPKERHDPKDKPCHERPTDLAMELLL